MLPHARLSFAAAMAAACTPALAHPGHSAIATSFAEYLHLLLSPDHLFGTIAAAVLVLGLLVAGIRRLARKERRRDPR